MDSGLLPETRFSIADHTGFNIFKAAKAYTLQSRASFLALVFTHSFLANPL